ncbi:hypothetical protein FRB91_000496 [Serendipita sp. 411]|nr:hypothetical protein FRB91_000496 [Serendipita sp. 411]
MNLDRSTSPPTSNEHNDYGMSPPRAQQSPDEGPSSKGRALSNSKRAEQNRRAQRAFRERRDAHVKHLESQAALVKETLAEAEVATKRWEECRALIEQLRYENTLLRAALDDAGIETESIPITQVPHLPNGPTTTMTTGSPVAITGTTNNGREGGGGGGGGTEQHLNGGIELHPVLQRNVDVVGPHLPKKRRRRDEANAGVEAQA